MKNVRNSICIVLLLIFTGSFVSYGQDSPKSVQEAKEKLNKQSVKKEADAKLSEQVAVKQSEVNQEKRDEELKAIKEKMEKVDN